MTVAQRLREAAAKLRTREITRDEMMPDHDWRLFERFARGTVVFQTEDKVGYVRLSSIRGRAAFSAVRNGRWRGSFYTLHSAIEFAHR